VSARAYRKVSRSRLHLDQSEMETFVRAWQAGESARAVAEQLGMGRQRARDLAKYLRKTHGVPLKLMPTGVGSFAGQRLDTRALAAVAREAAPKCRCGEPVERGAFCAGCRKARFCSLGCGAPRAEGRDRCVACILRTA
jgi:hypothetical protein